MSSDKSKNKQGIKTSTFQEQCQSNFVQKCTIQILSCATYQIKYIRYESLKKDFKCQTNDLNDHKMILTS